MATNIGLSVRQHEREKIRLPIEFIVCDEHREQVRFSSSSSAGRPHVIKGMVTDISRGGLGFDSYLFLPRMCEGKVRIFDRATTVSQIEPVPPRQPILETQVKIKRVLLQGQDPSYQIGIAFLNPPDNIEELIQNVFSASDASQEQTSLQEGDIDA